jgi:hypothetical protein
MVDDAELVEGAIATEVMIIGDRSLEQIDVGAASGILG